ncbi:MAG: hypothetical protein ACI85K_002089 [Hyphomicrobiaceae bacterium]|jgi:hypothetical protein
MNLPSSCRCARPDPLSTPRSGDQSRSRNALAGRKPKFSLRLNCTKKARWAGIANAAGCKRLGHRTAVPRQVRWRTRARLAHQPTRLGIAFGHDPCSLALVAGCVAAAANAILARIERELGGLPRAVDAVQL